jgi:hypothetical protein
LLETIVNTKDKKEVGLNKILMSTGANQVDWMPRELEQDKLKKKGDGP